MTYVMIDGLEVDERDIVDCPRCNREYDYYEGALYNDQRICYNCYVSLDLVKCPGCSDWVEAVDHPEHGRIADCPHCGSLVEREVSDCQWDCGKCAAQREDGGYWESGERGCCVSCAKMNGYIWEKDRTPQMLELFDPEVGYWSPEGCKLSRDQRSNICNGYQCQASQYTQVGLELV